MERAFSSTSGLEINVFNVQAGLVTLKMSHCLNLWFMDVQNMGLQKQLPMETAAPTQRCLSCQPNLDLRFQLTTAIAAPVKGQELLDRSGHLHVGFEAA